MAGYSVLITKSAAKELEGVPARDRQRIVGKIRTLADTPRPTGAEKLSGEDKYRLRQGDYRILYGIVDADLIVTVVRIGNRRNGTRRQRPPHLRAGSTTHRREVEVVRHRRSLPSGPTPGASGGAWRIDRGPRGATR